MISKRLRSALRLVLLPALVAVSLSAQAGPFSSLFVFGDSLSDTGNVSILSGGTFPPPPYSAGRFSDGPVWVETFAAGLGLAGQVNPALAGGTNYAFGGARTGAFSPVGDPPGVLAQVAGWGGGLVATPMSADPNALYVVVGGGNDMRDARSAFDVMDSTDPQFLTDKQGRQAAAQAAIDNLASAIAYLAASGAKNVLISTLPDLGATPEAAFLSLKAASTDVSTLFNDLVEKQLMLKGAFGDFINIELLDMAGVAANVHANPGDFGVTNTSLPCAGFAGSVIPGSDIPAASCATSLFSDALHPSAYAHLLIGQAALAVYGIPLPGTLALMGLAMLVLVGVQRRRQA